MSMTSSARDGAKRARTYLPDSDDRAEILDFAEFIRQLEDHLSQTSSRAALVDPSGQPRAIPEEIFHVLEQVTDALAAGQGITVAPQGMSMTTQQAAEFLGISRPTLVRLLESGEIPYEQPGRHRRVRLRDLIEYQSQSGARRSEALRDLAQANLKAVAMTGDPTAITRLSESPDA